MVGVKKKKEKKKCLNFDNKKRRTRTHFNRFKIKYREEKRKGSKHCFHKLGLLLLVQELYKNHPELKDEICDWLRNIFY